MTIRIAIATDHGGFEAKNELAEALASAGHFVMDCGTYEPDSTDYPIYASRLSMAVSQGVVDYGILLCRSGVGMSMVANRYPGVRAALVNAEETARLSRTHNNANVLVMGSDHMNASFLKLAEIFLSSDFEGGRHARRVGQIDMLDEITDAHNEYGHSRYHGQAVWTQNFLEEKDVSVFHHTMLRGYSVTLHSLIQLFDSNNPIVADRFEKLNARSATVDEKIDSLIEHEIIKTAEALHPIATFTRGEDGSAIVPVPLGADASSEDFIKRVSEYRDRWADFQLAYRIPATPNGIEAAFALLKENQSIVLYGFENAESVASIFDQFTKLIPELRSTTSYLVIQIPNSLLGTEDLKKLIAEKTSFNIMADAYRRGIQPPIIIREGSTLSNEYISGTKFLLSDESLKIKSESEALVKLHEILS